MFEFGFGKECVTPKMGTPMIGQVVQMPCDGTYTDLFARALYISNKRIEFILITCDLLCLENENVDFIRSEISKNTKVDINKIIIHTTHTHAGPAVTNIFNIKKEEQETAKEIFKKIIEAGTKAVSNKFTGNLFHGKDYLEISYNRRYIMKSGKIELHPFKDDPDLLEPEGPNDPELNILVIKDIDNKIRGIIANYPCHLTSLERYNTKISADFPAYAEMELKTKFDNDDFILFYFNGTCGNLCPVNVADKDSAEFGDGHSRKLGKIFAASVMKIIDNLIADNSEINFQYEKIRIPIRKITKKMISKAKKTIDFYRDFDFKPFKLSEYGVEGHLNKEVISADELIRTDYWKNMAANELINLHERYKNDDLVEIPLTAITIDEVLILTIPAEVFVEYGLKIKKKLKSCFKAIFILELSNGWVGYVPTGKAFLFKEKCAYEVQLLNSSKLTENAGSIITDELIKMARNLAKTKENKK